jgi:hypothetical protein
MSHLFLSRNIESGNAWTGAKKKQTKAKQEFAQAGAAADRSTVSQNG